MGFVLRVSRTDELNYKLNASSSIYVVLVTQTRSLIFVSLWVNGTEETHKYLCVSMTAQFVAPRYSSMDIRFSPYANKSTINYAYG